MAQAEFNFNSNKEETKSANPAESNKPKRLFLIDGSALFYRSYFAFIRNPLFNSKGENTSAVYGFTNSLFKLLMDEKPDYIAVVFDTAEPTFRHKKYKPYKATREKMPDEMATQYPRIVELVKGFNLPLLEMPGYEADDVIGTLAKKAEREGIETVMVNGDKDFMQLVSPLVKMYTVRPGKDVEIIDPEALKEKMGLTPEQVRDYLALMGDSSDNIPGVPKVGPKTALELIQQFGSLDSVYANIDRITRETLKRNLLEYKNQAYLSKDLVTIDTKVPVDVDVEALKAQEPDIPKLVNLFQEMEFDRLLNRLEELTGKSIAGKKDFASEEQQYHLVDSPQSLKKLTGYLEKQGFFVFDTETTGLNPFDSEIIGFSFSCKAREAYYVPMNFEKGNLSSDGVLAALKPLLEKSSVKKGGQNIKFDGLMLWQHNIELQGISFDTMIADYLINPGTRQHNLTHLARQYLNYQMIPIEELIGKKGKSQKSMNEVAVEEISNYAAEDADITFRLVEILSEKLDETQTRHLFDTVEMPLVEVLLEMEKNGVSLDEAFLKKMSGELDEELRKLEQEIYQLAGEEFNINSPQQLGI
ncbi:MAG: 5'-3' exonuclease H3TH domain-containing protein, partial [Calditrichia bacterium]